MIEYVFAALLVLIVMFIWFSKSEQAYDPNKRFILNQPIIKPESSEMRNVPRRYKVKAPSASFIPSEIDYANFEESHARNLYDKTKNAKGMTRADLALESTLLSGN